MDVRTLFFVEASLLFLFGFTMIVNSIGQPSQQGNYWFAASNFSGGIGLILHSAVPTGPVLITVVLANIFLFVELSLLNKAIAEFVGRGRRVWLYLLGLSALTSLATIRYTLWPEDHNLRIAFISVVTISTAVCSAALLFRFLSHSAKIPTLVMGTLLTLYASTNTIRLFTVWFHPQQSFYHIWLDRTIIAGLSFGYLWMTAARLRDDLQRLANTDALTGTLNRRAVAHETERIVAYSREGKDNVSVLMLDIDYFKQINDVYGHHAGDLALRAVADCLRQTMRAEDLIARLGGDEFLVIMPDTPLDTAHLAANRLRTRFETLEVLTDTGSFNVQASIGVTSFDAHNLRLEDLMQFGDRALYAAKASNRRPATPSLDTLPSQEFAISPPPQAAT